MTEPKQHHFVPEALQARFTNEESRLYYFDRVRPELGVRRGSPGNLFKEGHLYSVTDAQGVRSTAFETELSKLEGRAGLIIDKIVSAARAKRTPGLSASERCEWDDFFLMQWRRVPANRRLRPPVKAEQEVQDLLAVARARWPHRHDEIDALSTSGEIKRIAQNARVDALKLNLGSSIDALRGRGLAVVHITNPRHSFVLGSLPVVKLTNPGCTDLRNFEVEMWLPVAHDVMVGVGHLKGFESYIQTTDTNMIRALNAAIVGQSSMFAGRSEAQVRSLAASAPAWDPAD